MSKNRLKNSRGLDRLLLANESEPPVAEPAPDIGAFGYQTENGFRPMENLTLVGIERDYRRRFEFMVSRPLADILAAIQLIFIARMQADLPDSVVDMTTVSPRGDFAIVVKNVFDAGIVNSREYLQARLDDACARLAAALGA